MAFIERIRPAMSPMFRMALVSGSAATVLLHLRRGAERDGRDAAGSTPLMIAAARGRLEVCELLIAEGADVGATDAGGRDALDLAQAGQHHRIADLLRAHRHPREDPPRREPVATPAEKLLRVDDEDLPDSGLWEPEAEPVRPANDTALVLKTTGVQLSLAGHRAVDHDADWSDVVVELPAPVAYRRDDPVLQRQFGRLTLLLGTGRQEGAVAESALDAAFAPGAGEAAEPARIRREAAGSAFADLGIGLDEDRDWRSGARPIRASVEDLDEVRAFIESVEAGADVLGPFYRELAREPRMNPEEEQRLWRSMDDEAVRLGGAALAEPAHLPALLTELERQSALAAEAAQRRSAASGENSDRAGAGGDVAAAEARAQLIGLLGRYAGEATGVQLDERARSTMLRLFGRLHPSAEALSGLCAAVLQGAESSAARAVLVRIEDIRARATRSHLKLVIWWARRYARRGLDLADLIQEGSIGLMRATARYEWVRGHKFSTYASWWIRQAISRAIADGEHLIRRPVHLTELLSRVARSRTSLAGTLQRDPTTAELAAELGETKDRLGRTLARLSEVVPFNEAGDRDEDDSHDDPGTATTAFSEVIQTELRMLLSESFACLSPREERILRLRFGFGHGDEHTLEECGEMFGVTRERIRQIEAKALRRLKHPTGVRRLLRTFLGA